MTQIDLCALKQKMAYELSNLIPQSYSEATLFNALDYLSGKGYLAQATKADVPEYRAEMTATEHTKFTRCRVEVQAPEAGVEMPERVWAWISKGGIFKWGWQIPRKTPKRASEYIRADIYQNKCAIYSELFKVQRPSGDDDLIKSHDTLLSIARGVQGYWTTSNDCLDSQACVDEAIANAEKLKERLDK